MQFCSSISQRVKPEKSINSVVLIYLYPCLVSDDSSTIWIEICWNWLNIVSSQRELEEAICCIFSHIDISTRKSIWWSCCECFSWCCICYVRPSTSTSSSTSDVESIKSISCSSSERIDISTILNVRLISPLHISCLSCPVCTESCSWSSTTSSCRSHCCPSISRNRISVHCDSIVSKKIEEIIVSSDFIDRCCIWICCPCSRNSENICCIWCDCSYLTFTSSSSDSDLIICPLIDSPCFWSIRESCCSSCSCCSCCKYIIRWSCNESSISSPWCWKICCCKRSCRSSYWIITLENTSSDCSSIHDEKATFITSECVSIHNSWWKCSVPEYCACSTSIETDFRNCSFFSKICSSSRKKSDFWSTNDSIDCCCRCERSCRSSCCCHRSRPSWTSTTSTSTKSTSESKRWNLIPCIFIVMIKVLNSCTHYIKSKIVSFCCICNDKSSSCTGWWSWSHHLPCFAIYECNVSVRDCHIIKILWNNYIVNVCESCFNIHECWNLRICLIPSHLSLICNSRNCRDCRHCCESLCCCNGNCHISCRSHTNVSENSDCCS